jgi:hypothetical protein
MTIDKRIEKLEQGMKRTKRTNAGLCITLCVAMTMLISGAAKEKEIRTKKIVLEDEQGRMRMLLNAVGDKPGMVLYDDMGNCRGELILHSTGHPGLHFYNAEKRENVSLISVQDLAFLTLREENDTISIGKSKSGTGIEMNDKNGIARIKMTLMEVGPYIGLNDKSGVARVSQFEFPDLSGVSVFDENGHTRLNIGMTKDGPSLQLYGEKHALRASLGMSKTRNADGTLITQPESTLLLFDTGGKVIWEAPR